MLRASDRIRPQLNGALTDIAAGARRAGEVIRRLRALFRKKAAGRSARPLMLQDSDPLLRSAPRNVGSCRARIVGIGLEFSLGKDLQPVLSYVVQLQQVILNIIINAADAMAGLSPGRAFATIETRPSAYPEMLEITTSTAALGVGEDDLDRSLQPFVTTKTTGLGMGLSISRSIVQAHGGRIWLTRNDDHGLMVHVELPCDENGSPAGGVPVGLSKTFGAYDQGPIAHRHSGDIHRAWDGP